MVPAWVKVYHPRAEMCVHVVCGRVSVAPGCEVNCKQENMLYVQQGSEVKGCKTVCGSLKITVIIMTIIIMLITVTATKTLIIKLIIKILQRTSSGFHGFLLQ